MTKKESGKAYLLSCVALAVLLCLTVSCDVWGNNVNIGTYCGMQEAYDNGWITVEDLQSIANHQNNGTDPNDTLSAEVEKAIKKTVAKDLRSFPYPILIATVKDVTIDRYYGTYNNCVAVMISNAYTEYPQALWDDVIAGVIFHYYDGNVIVIWKQD